MQELEKEGHLDVYYGDESGFSLTSAIPYGWQFPGEQVATRPRHSQRFNVLGFYNAATNDLHTAIIDWAGLGRGYHRSLLHQEQVPCHRAEQDPR